MTVFRKLQLKVMLNILVVHTLILAGLFGTLNSYIRQSSKHEADTFLDILLKTEGINVFARKDSAPNPNSVLPFGPAVPPSKLRDPSLGDVSHGTESISDQSK